MSNFNMNRTDHATLLAKKLFTSNNADEIHAFVSLDLDVNWLTKLGDQTLLIERAFRVVNDEEIFDQWWANVQRQHPNTNVWTLLPNQQKLVNAFLQPAGCHSFKAQLLKDCPGSVEEQTQLAQSPKAIESALRPTWGKVSEHLKRNGLISTVADKLDEYRATNLYLTASSVKDFDALRPKTLSPANAMDMYVRLNGQNVTNKNLWYVHEFMDAPWDKWTPEQWAVALENHRPGVLMNALEVAENTYCSYSAPKSGRSRYEQFGTQIEKFYKKAPDLGTLTETVLYKDTVLLSRFDLRPSNDDSRLFYQKLGRGLQSMLEKAAANPSANTFNLGVTAALIDTKCFKTTMISPRAVALLEKSILPTTVEEMCNHISNDLAKGLSSSKVIGVHNLAMLATHVGAALRDDAQKIFLNSLQDSELYRSKMESISLGVLNWSIKGMETAQSEQEKSNWANMYWQSIFYTQTANQHYWLKKIHGIQDFIVPVDCWDKEFEETLMSVLGKRKSNDAIQSVLSKMSLVNATSELGLPEPVKRRSKM